MLLGLCQRAVGSGREQHLDLAGRGQPKIDRGVFGRQEGMRKSNKGGSFPVPAQALLGVNGDHAKQGVSSAFGGVSGDRFCRDEA